MADRKNHIGNTLSPEMMERYLKGELSYEQMHKVEKLMLSSDFDAEAMEGFEAAGPDLLTSDLAELESRLEERVQPARRYTGLWLKIAASVALLAISTFIIFELQLPPKSKSESALNEAPRKGTTPEVMPPAPEEEQYEPMMDSLIALQDEEVTEEEIIKTPHEKEEVNRTASRADSDASLDVDLKDQNTEAAEEAKPVTLAEVAQENEAITEDNAADKMAMVEPVLPKSVAGAPPERDAAGAERSKKRELSTRSVMAEAAKQYFPKVITGKVTSADDGTALPGVNIVVKGTTTGTVTDLEGNYKLTLPETNDPVIVVSFIGLNSQEVPVTNDPEINVEMESDVSQLSEVVVTGYAKDEQPSPDVIVRAKPAEGNAAFKKYIEANLQHPSDSVEVKGKVVVEFDVMPSGELRNFTIIRGLGETYDQEAIRLIKKGPDWKPTTRNGIPETDRVRVKIKF